MKIPALVLFLFVPIASAHADEFFAQKVEPLLKQRCFECHSHARKIMGGLTLDSKSGWQKGGDSGTAVVPGKPDDSLLIKAVRQTDPDLKMPPKGPLSEAETAVLVEWVRRGAADPRVTAVSAEEAWKQKLADRSTWWSLQPPQPSEPPSVDDPAWQNEPVDRFILAKLKQAGLSPAPPATAEVLARRLSFVLTGLPPSSHASLSPDQSYESIVETLLASEHFGERMARHWMDVVRYTDTYGYEWDMAAKGSWEYRDYLIRAFNDDIGFDQLIREQVAGDLLPQPRINARHGLNESLIGPMFYHMGEHRHGSSLDFNGIHQEMIDNKIDAFSKAILGMTVACARCHDHKLDAISQADYYALAGVFMTPRWATRVIDVPDRNDQVIAELKRRREEIRQALAAAWKSRTGDLQPAKLKAWTHANRSSLSSARIEDVAYPFARLLAAVRRPAASYEWLKVSDLDGGAAAAGTKLALQPDGSLLAEGDAPPTDTYTVRFTTSPGSADVLRLEALTHPSLGKGGPGRTPHGNFVLTALRVEVAPLDAKGVKAGQSRPLALAGARADFSQEGYSVEQLLKPGGRGWGIGMAGGGKINVDRTAWFTFAAPIKLPHGGEWTVTLEQNHGDAHTLGRFRLTPGLARAETQTETPTNVADTTVADTWKQLAAEWHSTRDARVRGNARFTVVTDFTAPGFPAGWVVEGDGITHGHVVEGTPLVSLEGSSLLTSLLPRGYHTHALSSKLPGVVRPPAPERFPQPWVSLQLAGGEWAGRNVVPQNAFLNEGHGGPSFFDPSAQPQWTALAAVPLKNGVTRVLTEICTTALNPNFPPRTGLARAGNTTLPSNDTGFDKRSWFSLTGIVAHEAGGAPEDELAPFVRLYDSTAPTTEAAAWETLSAWLTGAVERWISGNGTAGDVRLLNWMIVEKLLPNDAAALPEVAALVEQYRQAESRIAFPRTANSMDERGVEPVNYRLNERGNVHEEGPAIHRDFLEVFAGKHAVRTSEGSGRLELAQYLGSRDNPQTARVYVNRVWQWVFGTGLVNTPSDFGKLGDLPSHPELLDWLALRFMEEGWSTKRLIRRLVLSRTFRQSGQVSTAGAERDPVNRLLHHHPTRRLEAEAIRDSLLAVSGRLDPQLYGRPIRPPRTAEDAAKRLFSGPLDGAGRRSIYIEMSIMAPPAFLAGFNLPGLKLPTGRRDVTNVPGQALLLLNDPFVNAMADYWADHLLQDARTDPADRLRAMFRAALARSPDGAELQTWLEAARTFAAGNDLMTDKQAWAAIAHALFNTKEFIYYR